MPSVLRKTHSYFTYLLSGKNRKLYKKYKIITGKRPHNLKLYERATRHTSVAGITPSGIKDSYERLEYLGDSIIGMIVAEMLFKKFPLKGEDFLTELRCRIVNRESLNKLSKKTGISNLVKFHKAKNAATSHKYVYGDSLEALIGAVYLDQGFGFAKKFIEKKLISPHFDFDELSKTTSNYKSKIIEWAQREDKNLRFDVQPDTGVHGKQFIAQVIVDGQPMGIGLGLRKKKAEQVAAQKTLEELNIE